MRHVAPVLFAALTALTALTPLTAAAQDAPRPAVVVELIDGRTYEGELVARADGKVVVETLAGERVVVPEGAVREVRAAKRSANTNPDAPVYEAPQDGWRITMSGLGAGLGALIGSSIALGGVANDEPIATTIGLLATPTLAGLGAWYAGSSYDDRATPTGAIIGSAVGGFAGLGAGLTLTLAQVEPSGFTALGLTFAGVVAGAVMGHELELDQVELEELRVGVAPTPGGGAAVVFGGRF